MLLSQTSAMEKRHYKKCVVCGAKRYRDSNLFLAKFPLNPVRCRKWVKAIGIEDYAHMPIEKLHVLKYVCGSHFTRKSFNKQGSRLRLSAVPTINLPHKPLNDEVLKEFPLYMKCTRKIVMIPNKAEFIETDVCKKQSSSSSATGRPLLDIGIPQRFLDRPVGRGLHTAQNKQYGVIINKEHKRSVGKIEVKAQNHWSDHNYCSNVTETKKDYSNSIDTIIRVTTEGWIPKKVLYKQNPANVSKDNTVSVVDKDAVNKPDEANTVPDNPTDDANQDTQDHDDEADHIIDDGIQTDNDHLPEENVIPQEKTYSWQKHDEVVPIPADDVEMEDNTLNLSMFCEDEDKVSKQLQDHLGDGSIGGSVAHAEFRCDECDTEITDFRYTCVQCSDFDLCAACEGSRAHHQHYVLRVPGQRPATEVMSVLAAIRRYLMQKLDPISGADQDLDAISIKSEVKSENEDSDNDDDHQRERNTESRHSAYNGSENGELDDDERIGNSEVKESPKKQHRVYARDRIRTARDSTTKQSETDIHLERDPIGIGNDGTPAQIKQPNKKKDKNKIVMKLEEFLKINYENPSDQNIRLCRLITQTGNKMAVQPPNEVRVQSLEDTAGQSQPHEVSVPLLKDTAMQFQRKIVPISKTSQKKLPISANKEAPKLNTDDVQPIIKQLVIRPNIESVSPESQIKEIVFRTKINDEFKTAGVPPKIQQRGTMQPVKVTGSPSQIKFVRAQPQTNIVAVPVQTQQGEETKFLDKGGIPKTVVLQNITDPSQSQRKDVVFRTKRTVQPPLIKMTDVQPGSKLLVYSNKSVAQKLTKPVGAVELPTLPPEARVNAGLKQVHVASTDAHCSSGTSQIQSTPSTVKRKMVFDISTLMNMQDATPEKNSRLLPKPTVNPALVYSYDPERKIPICSVKLTRLPDAIMNAGINTGSEQTVPLGKSGGNNR